jgi:hypothetical protein
MCCKAVHTAHNDGGGQRLDLSLEWSGRWRRSWRCSSAQGPGVVESEAQTFTRLAEQD